jgi:hypothetical protein
MVREVRPSLDASLVFSMSLMAATSASAFSNSFLVLEARGLNFAVVSLFASYIFIHRCRKKKPVQYDLVKTFFSLG